jgi:xanthine dehydrogenase accessory factor
LKSWRHNGIVDDIRPLLLQSLPDVFAIATLVAADGPSPRDVGAQMLITRDNYWGFLSGGCVEEDIARHAREAMAAGEHRLLRYGEGSPWFDIKLACGAGISVLVEPVTANDPAIATLLSGYRERTLVVWESDGQQRQTAFSEATPTRWDGQTYTTSFAPPLRLIVIGEDATALALTSQSLAAGIGTALIATGGPNDAPFAGIEYCRANAAYALAQLKPDRWSAVAAITHDRDDDESALTAALLSNAFYVGAIGSRARLEPRLARLQNAGVDQAALKRLHAPVGAAGLGKSPQDIALSIVFDVKREFHSLVSAAKSDGVSISAIAPMLVTGK